MGAWKRHANERITAGKGGIWQSSTARHGSALEDNEKKQDTQYITAIFQHA
jgi:hypothetical protein